MKQRNQTRRVNRDEIEVARKTSEKGRLQRLLSKTIFSPRYIAYVMSNPEGLLRMPYLLRELQAMKRILKALKKRSNDPKCNALYERINMLDGSTKPTSPLCAIARHLTARSMHLDLDSLFFDDCMGEWTMETIVHGIAPFTDDQRGVVGIARESFETIQNAMKAAGAGYVEVGAFEPDLRSSDEFFDKAALRRLCMELGCSFPETGAFVVCSHRLVRVQSDDLYQSLLDAEFPGYRRVHRKHMDRNKSLQQNWEDILDYIWKLEELVNGADGDAQIAEGDCRRCIRVTSLGTTTDGLKGRTREDALCDFGLFLDDLGLDFFKINHVNIFARAWYNEDERLMFTSKGIELMDAPGVCPQDLHTHCNDAPRRRLLQETPGYSNLPLRDRTRLLLAQRDMETLNTSREVGPLIPSGQKLEFTDGTEGFSIPIVSYGARSEQNKRRSDQKNAESRRVVAEKRARGRRQEAGRRSNRLKKLQP
ncbi:hypothetical protein [Litoreibacter roseus]|nr:hypothetical protein [Litoreibacter roseus]